MSFWSTSVTGTPGAPPPQGAFGASHAQSSHQPAFSQPQQSSYGSAPPAHGSPGVWGAASTSYGGGSASSNNYFGSQAPAPMQPSFFGQPAPQHQQPAAAPSQPQFGFSSSSNFGGYHDGSAMSGSGGGFQPYQQPQQHAMMYGHQSQQQQSPYGANAGGFFGSSGGMQSQQHFASTSKAPQPGSPWGVQYSSPAKDSTPGRGASPKASPPMGTQGTPSHSGVGYGYSSRLHSGRESIGRQHSNLRHASEDLMDDDAPPTASALGNVNDDYELTAEPSSFEPPSSLFSFAPRHQPSTSSNAISPASDSGSSDANAVIVFGFSPEYETLVTRHFAALGEVRQLTPGAGGNWLTIVYADPATAMRAVRLHGEMIGPNLMIAVKFANGDAAARSSSTPASSSAVAVRPSATVAPPKSPEPAIGARASVLPAASALRRAPTSSRLFGLFAAGSETPPASPKPITSAPSTPATATPAAPSTPSGFRGALMDRIFGFL